MELIELRKKTADHDRLNCECELCREYDRRELEYKDGLHLTTDHPASYYGIPVLVDADGIAYGTGDDTPVGWALTLYHLIADNTGWKLEWTDFGHTLIGGVES